MIRLKVCENCEHSCSADKTNKTGLPFMRSGIFSRLRNTPELIYQANKFTSRQNKQLLMKDHFFLALNRKTASGWRHCVQNVGAFHHLHSVFFLCWFMAILRGNLSFQSLNLLTQRANGCIAVSTKTTLQR